MEQLNPRLETLTFAFLLRIVSELLARGVFLSRDAIGDVIGLYEFSTVKSTIFEQRPARG